MRKRLLLPFCLLFLFSLLLAAARACAQPGIYPPTTWTTHIAAISPQTGVAGVTKIYVRGYCFGTTYGDTSGLGFVSVGGVRVPAANVSMWTDAEIIFTLPFTAVSGDFVVTASSSTGYGSDDSASETGCPRNNGWPSGYNGYYCGNDMINASFTVLSPSNPPFYLPAGSTGCPGSQPCVLVLGSPSTPQYVGGTWFYSDGGGQDELVLTQGAQNSDGTWTISGTEYPNTGPSGPVTGTLNQSGDLTLAVNNGGTCLEYYILGSGDVTSQGYINGSGGPQNCVPLPGGFLNDYTSWEASYWYFAAPPLIRSQTDLPASETPAPQGWAAPYPSVSTTVGLWERALVPLPASVNTYAGRFVFEQSGGTAGDTCWLTGSITGKATGVTGGGWYVTQTGNWGWDYVGMWSQGVDWYQAHQPNLPCDITIPQQMNINGDISRPQPYTTNQLMYEIDATKVYSEVQTQGGSVTFECEYYSNSTLGNRPCKK